jgi:hypothetical protein
VGRTNGQITEKEDVRQSEEWRHGGRCVFIGVGRLERERVVSACGRQGALLPSLADSPADAINTAEC